MKPITHALLPAMAAVFLTTGVAPAVADDAARGQLEEQITNELTGLGVELASYEMLTLDELSQIKAILDNDGGATEQVSAIENIIDTRSEEAGVEIELRDIAVTNQLREQVSVSLTQMGIDADVTVADFDALTQIKTAIDSGMSASEVEAELNALMAN